MKEILQSFDLSGDLSLPFWIDASGISYCDKTYKISRENSQVYVFEYVISGTGTIIYNDHLYSTSEKDVYILKKGSNHTYFADPDFPWTKIWFNIGGNIIENLIQNYLSPNQIIVPNCDETVLKLFQDFFELTKSQKNPKEIFNDCTLKFVEILIALSNLLDKPMNTQTRLAYHIRSILDSKVESHISLEELSSDLFYSKTYIINTFKEEFNQTPYEYLLHKKIETAKHLLASDEFSIKYIAHRLAFADAHYFSNQFKKYTGLSPSSYRQSLLF